MRLTSKSAIVMSDVLSCVIRGTSIIPGKEKKRGRVRGNGRVFAGTARNSQIERFTAVVV